MLRVALAQSKSLTNDTVTGYSNAHETGLTVSSHRAAGGLWAEPLFLYHGICPAGSQRRVMGPWRQPIPQKPSERGGSRARFIEGASLGRGGSAEPAGVARAGRALTQTFARGTGPVNAVDRMALSAGQDVGAYEL